VNFSPEGYPQIVCDLNMVKLSKSTAQANCGGKIPGVGDLPAPKPTPRSGCQDIAVGVADTSVGSIYTTARPCRSQAGGRPLPVGKKIAFGKIICAVGRSAVVACLIKTDNGAAHGFVISQQRTWTF
jgi:hypothetical protein